VDVDARRLDDRLGRPEGTALRLFLVGSMVVCTLMAIAIPDAFGERGMRFAASYVALRLALGS
jgi:low temperature requirement protein LtrA